MRWKVYILECKNGALYTGITTDLERRFKEHFHNGARYTRANPPDQVVYSESRKNRSSALKREAEIKSWPRARKLKLIQKV